MKRSTVVVMVVALVLGAAAGCQDDEHFPPGEGGGPSGGGGSNQNDAGGGGSIDGGTGDAGTGDAGATLAGELCDVIDLRRPEFCSDVNLSGIEVRVLGEDASDLTNADGRFSLDVEPEADVLLEISSTDETTRLGLTRFDMWSQGGLRVPRVERDVWIQLIEGSIGTTDPEDLAAIALYVRDLDGIAVPNVAVDLPDGAGSLVYYDAGAADEWSLLGTTGDYGAALIVQVPVADGTVVVMVGKVPIDIPVAEGRLTWARVRV
jgi:hypothetical protein